MPLKNFDALTFPDLILLRGTFVEPGTLPWLLSEHHRLLFPEWLFKGWKGERKVGREAWPAPRLMAMLLLRHSEAGMTRVGAVRKANTDAAWRTALRLPWLYPPPDEKTCREFEAFMKSPHPDVNRRWCPERGAPPPSQDTTSWGALDAPPLHVLSSGPSVARV